MRGARTRLGRPLSRPRCLEGTRRVFTCYFTPLVIKRPAFFLGRDHVKTEIRGLILGAASRSLMQLNLRIIGGVALAALATAGTAHAATYGVSASSAATVYDNGAGYGDSCTTTSPAGCTGGTGGTGSVSGNGTTSANV